MEQAPLGGADGEVISGTEAGVTTITLDAPRRGNALSMALMRGLCAALRAAQSRPDVAVIVLRANGKHFCAGADLGWAGARDKGDEAQWNAGNAALQELLDTLFALAKPVVARVHGTVIGGGVALLCLCDDVLALDTAHWRLPELPLGMVPTAIVPPLRQVAPQHAIRRMLFDQTPWNSVDAQGFGIVSHVAASPEALDALTRARTDAWLALPPAAVAATKRWMRELGARDWRESIERGQAHAASLCAKS